MIIGVGYRAQSGKDAVSSYLCSAYGFVRFSFADPLKDACAAIYGFTQEQLYGDKKYEVDPVWNVSPGEVLQRVGTDLFRKHWDSDIWIKSSFLRLQRSGVPLAVTPDVRFHNEVEAIRRHGGVVIEISRPKHLKKPDKRDPNHASETALDGYLGWDYRINNDSTDLPTLYSQVDKIALDLGLCKI